MRSWLGVAVSVLATAVFFQSADAVEPITAGGVLAVSAGLAFYKYLGCQYEECCGEPWIRKLKCAELNKGKKELKENLEASLKRALHGQPLVLATVPGSIAQHICNPNPKKALVMSFHGWTGGGKNYASTLIANYLYKKGMDSDYVKLYASTHHFPHKDEIGSYKKKLKAEIVEQVKKCPRSMFIFDEVDKMPPGLIDTIKPFLDFHEKLDGVDYRKCIFILLTNTAGNLIATTSLQYWKDGIDRNKIPLKEIEEVIALGSFNEKGGLYHSSVVNKNLIDVYVPFLPLEKKHINQCIEDDFKRKNVKPTNRAINRIANDLEYIPKEFQRYSSTGCKKVQHKVQLYLHGSVDDDDEDEDDSEESLEN